jgi:PAS domain S-box-containing protein
MKVLQGTGEGIVVTDLSGRIVEVNEAFCRLAGYGREDLLGNNPRILRSDRHEPEFHAGIRRSIAETGQWSGEIWNRRKNGEIYPKWLTINTLYDDAGRPDRHVGLATDIGRAKEAEARLAHPRGGPRIGHRVPSRRRRVHDRPGRHRAERRGGRCSRPRRRAADSTGTPPVLRARRASAGSE